MNFRFQHLVTSFLMLGLIASVQADVVLQDDFDDGVVDPAKWISVINGTSTIDEIDGQMVAQTIDSDRSYLVTAGEWNPSEGAITMTGTLTILEGNPNCNIWTRASDHPDSNGLPNGGGVLSDGVFVGYWQGSMGALVKYDTVWPWEAVGDSVSLPDATQTVWDFSFTDDGTTITMTMTDPDNTANTATWNADTDFDQGVYHLAYSATDMLLDNMVITVGAVLPGDANGDGSVDVTDLGILATNYGAGSGFAWDDGDFTGDGLVDVSDLGILATNYGTAAAAAVPEPSAFVMLGCLLALLIARRIRSTKV